MPIKDKTLRSCVGCDAVWRGAVVCPLCEEPTAEPIDEVMLALMPDDIRHDN